MGIVLDFGERRHIKLMILSCKKEDFEIMDCDYELKKIWKFRSGRFWSRKYFRAYD